MNCYFGTVLVPPYKSQSEFRNSLVGPRLRTGTAGRALRAYFFMMFLPKLYFVPTVARTVLRPPSNMPENIL